MTTFTDQMEEALTQAYLRGFRNGQTDVLKALVELDGLTGQEARDTLDLRAVEQEHSA